MPPSRSHQHRQTVQCQPLASSPWASFFERITKPRLRLTQETLGLLFDWTVFDWSEYHQGYAPEDISLFLPERFFRVYASIEKNVLESLQDVRHRILTGQ